MEKAMKLFRKWILLILAVCLIYGMAACESRYDWAESDDEDDFDEDAHTTESSKFPTLSPEGNGNAIRPDGVTAIGEIAEIELVHVFVSKDVKPPKPDSVYSHYEAEDGQTYLVVVMDVKNLGTDAVPADEILVPSLTVGDRSYSVNTVAVTEEGADLDSGSFTDIVPLDTIRLYQLFSVPESSDFDSLKLVVEADDLSYTAEFSVAYFQNKIRKIEIGKEITDGQTLSATVESVTVQNTLYPPNATGYYHYYEADAGKTFLIVKMTVTNLKTTDLKYNAVAGVDCVYNEKYNYSFSTVFEEDGGEDLNGYPSLYSIAPLDSGVLYYLAEVPEEVGAGPVQLHFYLCGNYYTYRMNE
jgi:hypothetical protein